jgi:nucleoside-diphosphate-sugar epimerase
VKIIDLAQTVQTAMGFDGPLRAEVVSYESMGGNYQDVKIRVPSIEKAERILGFKAQVKLDAGLVSTIAWHRALREEQVPA